MLPELTNKNLANFLDKEEIIKATADQITKDLAMFGVIITYSGNTHTAYEELHAQLTTEVKRILKSSFTKLISILYRIDISEKDVAKATLEMEGYDNAQVIAHQIIFRELKKVLTRKYYS